MIFAEFYDMTVAGSWNNNISTPKPACGDRGVIILDGRQRMATHVEIARSECAKRGFYGFTINSGSSFNSNVVTRKYESVP